MSKSLIVVFLALVLVQALRPWLARLGLGKLPGDFHFHALGREWYLPFASSVLLSFVCMLIGALI
jgi:hypothetical protein